MVEAVPSVVVDGVRYEFAGWSDGGARIHEIITPQQPLTLTAQYLPARLVGQSQVAMVAAGPGIGSGALAAGFEFESGTGFSLQVFDSSFTGGVRTAAADVNGDGIADLIAGSGPGRRSEVHVYDGHSRNLLQIFQPFEPSFTGGVFVAADDINRDGAADLVVTPDFGGGPRVRLYDGRTGASVADFFGISDLSFRGGAFASLGDLDGDRVPDLLVAAGFGGGPRVAGYDGSSLTTGSQPARIFNDFFVFEHFVRAGAFLAAGDVNGDGYADLVAGAGVGGGPRVLAISGRELVQDARRVPVANFFAGDVDRRGGVPVTVKDLDGDAFADIVTGSGRGEGPVAIAYAGKEVLNNGSPEVLDTWLAFAADFRGGVFVG